MFRPKVFKFVFRNDPIQLAAVCSVPRIIPTTTVTTTTVTTTTSAATTTEMSVKSKACPVGWEATETNAACTPLGLAVTCSTNQMTVTMNMNHLYNDPDRWFDEEEKTKAKAIAGSCTVGFSKGATNSTITYNLSQCDTVARHESGNLIFTTTFKVSKL